MKKVTILLLLIYSIGLATETGARYLIITHDNFYNAIQPLAQWKHKKGMRTKVVRLSEIGANPTSAQIRTYIVNAYNNWQIRPEFLLLVGAHNYLPFPTVSGTYSDNYYTNMDADIFNEILSGRLTVHDTIEAKTVVNKILLYERTPYMADTMWFIRTCLIVREDYDAVDDSIYWSDARHVRNLMLSAGYNVIDTLSRIAGDDYNDVIQRVNLGRSFVVYRGQGVNNWWSPFDCTPAQCTNGAKLPIVLSITCSTIGISSPAAAEMWFLTGTPTTPKGASGYFATTTTLSGGAHLRSAVCKGFFNSIFIGGKKTFGEACEGGRLNVYNLSASEYRGFTTIGDPEMNIWTDTPDNFVITHAPVLPIGPTPFTLNVHVENDEGVPVNQAKVCLWKQNDSVYVVNSTDVNGDISFTFDPSPLTQGIMYVTVTKPNYRPREDSVNVGGHVLNLNDFPMYPAAATPGYNEMCGAAIAQMTLNYLWWNNIAYPSGPPLTFNDQTWLYNYGIEHNENPGIYFDLDGMWHAVQDNKPMPYSQYGYNFTKLHTPMLDTMLKRICVWIDYTVGTYGGHEDGHPYHVPAIVPIYGNYTNWVAIRGIHTNIEAYPIPPELTIYGFWVNDPYPSGLGGLGENSYKTIEAWNNNYYVPMEAGEYIGEYLGIFEPPEFSGECDLSIAEPNAQFTSAQINHLKLIRQTFLISEPARSWIIKAAIDGVNEELIPYDENFATVFAKTMPGEPIFVKGISGKDYYAVPFVLSGKIKLHGNNDNTMVLILIDAEDGSFNEASWINKGVKYPPLPREKSQYIVLAKAKELGIPGLEIELIKPVLVYRKASPYYPEWYVRIQQYEIYISQNGLVCVEKANEETTGDNGTMSQAEGAAIVYALNTAMPTPFLKSTKISYSIAKSGHVSLNVYDISGRLVKTLVNANKDAGIYSQEWNGYDNNNQKLAPGIYFAKLASGDFVSVKKLILIK